MTLDVIYFMNIKKALYKPVVKPDEAVQLVKDGDSVMIGGFGGAGFPFSLRDALSKHTAGNLTVISNNADFGLLASAGKISRLYTSYPVGPSALPVIRGIERGDIELILTPQGTLIEQIRAGGVGIGGILTPTGIDSDLQQSYDRYHGKDGEEYFVAPALTGSVSLIAGTTVDYYGNVYCRGASLNFNLIMAMAGKITIVETANIVEVGEIPPDLINIPSVFIDYISITTTQDN